MESLGLDIKIIIAQIVNFGILFFVFKKVLYKPFIKILDERNKKINDSVTNSQEIEEKLKSFEDKERNLLAKARESAEKERYDLLRLAEIEKQKIVEEAKKVAQVEIQKGLLELKNAKSEAISEVTDKFIKEMTETLYKKVINSSKKQNYPFLSKLTRK